MTDPVKWKRRWFRLDVALAIICALGAAVGVMRGSWLLALWNAGGVALSLYNAHRSAQRLADAEHQTTTLPY